MASFVLELAKGGRQYLQFWESAAAMWRAFFTAIGIFLCLLGGEFLACEHLVLRAPKKDTQVQQTIQNVAFTVPAINQKRIYVPKDWMPWTLLASGAITLIYSIRPRT